MSGVNPIVAICATRRAAAEAVSAIRRAGVGVRRIAIVEREYPSGQASSELSHWPVLAPAWVTEGCLNAIGGGLAALGIPAPAIPGCRAALAADRILVVVQGTPEEISRARRACADAQPSLKSARKRSS